MTWMFTESGTERLAGRRRSGGSRRWAVWFGLRLSLDDRHVIHLELPSDQIRDLELTPDEPVFVVPRMINIFDVQKHTFQALHL